MHKNHNIMMFGAQEPFYDNKVSREDESHNI